MGDRLLTTGDDGRVRHWDARTGVGLSDEPTPGGLAAVAWRGPGAFLLSGPGGLYDTRSDASARLELGGATAQVATVSPDGQRVIVGLDNGTLRVLTPDEPARSVTLEAALALAVSPDSKTLAAGTFSGGLLMYDLSSAALVEKSKGVTRGTVRQLAWAPDGSMLAVSDAGPSIKLIGANGQAAKRLKGHEGPSFSVAFSADGSQVASGGQSGVVLVWDRASGERVHRLSGPGRDMKHVAFSPDGKLIAAASGDFTVHLWSLPSGRRIEPPVRAGHRGAVTGCAFVDGGVLTAGEDGRILLWNEAVGELESDVIAHDGGITWLAASATHRYSAGAGRLRVADHEQRSAQSHALESREEAPAMALAASGEVLLEGAHQLLLRASDGRLLKRVGPKRDEAYEAVAISRSGLLAGAIEADIWVYKPTGQLRHEISDDDAEPVSLSFAFGGITVGSEEGLLVLSLGPKPTPPPALEAGVMWVTGRDQLTAASDDGGTITVWRGAAVHRSFGGHEGEINALAISADGARLCTGSDDGTSLIWSL